MKKNFLVTLLMFAVSITACGDKKEDSGKVTLKFSNLTPEHAILAGEKFKEVAEAADPSLEVILYHKNVLGDDRVVVESTRLGDIDIAASSSSPLANTYPDFYLFDTPYLFLNEKEVDAALDGPVGAQLLSDIEGLNLKGLGFWENGFRNLTGNEKEVFVPEDVKGMKIRTMENEVHLAAWKAIGANPTPMAFSELFTALQQGTIDGQENPFTGIEAAKLQEVQKYMTVTEHVWTPWVLMMNLDKFNSLNESQKNAIMKASRASVVHSREMSRKLDKEIRKRFVEQGIVISELTPAQKQKWQDKIVEANIFDLVKKRMTNPEYLDRIISEK